MLNFRIPFAALTIAISLFLGPILGPMTAWAQSESLTTARISDYSAKLALARGAQADVEKRVLCLSDRDAQMVEQRNRQEARLGDLRRSEQDLAPRLAKQQDSYEAFLKKFDSEQRDFDELMRRYNELRARQYAQERALAECRRYLGPLCDAGKYLGNLAGLIENVGGDVEAASRRLNIAFDGMNDARSRLEESSQALSGIRSEMNGIAEAVRQAENQIVLLKSKLYDLRIDIQTYRNLLDDFETTLKEADRLDTADARARTARKAADLSAKIDATLARTAAAVAALPPEWMKTCSAA